MKNRKTLLAVLAGLALSSCTTRVTTENDASLKGVLGDKFLVGVALNTRQSSGVDTAAVKIVKRHFNSVVAENCMKCQTIHPEEDRYDFSQADEFVKFGEDNGMYIIGHCLVWHSQLAPWFCVDKDGKLHYVRRLNGDQDHQGRHVRISVGDFKILHVQLYEYQ